MKSVKITNMNILGVEPITENAIPNTIEDLDDGQSTLNRISNLEENKQNKIDSSNKLSADLIDDSTSDNKFVSSGDLTLLETLPSIIPATASSENQLADKNFVNSSIATNTANFIGTFPSISILLAINTLEVGSIVLTGSTIKEGSIINGSTITQDEILTNDLVITQTSFPGSGSIILVGSTIAQNSFINHILYPVDTIIGSDITIEVWTNNDYAFVTNNIDYPYEFSTYEDLISWTNSNLYLITNWDYAWVINTEDNTKFDLYRFEITTHTWELRVSKTDKADVTLNNAFNRYKYVEDTVEWVYEYTLNNSSFTAAQWAAINSGITANQVSQIAANTQAISNKADANNVITLDTVTQTFEGDKKLELGWDKKLDIGFENASYKGDLEFVGFNSNYSSPTITFKTGKYSPKNCTIALQQYSGSNYHLVFKGVSSTMDVHLPNVTGTVAMTSNIPTFLTFSNTSVAQADWVADNTYIGYGYKATLTLTGVTADMIPQVIYSADEAVSGNYLPIAESYAGGIYIYSKVDTAITIPTIILQKAGA